MVRTLQNILFFFSNHRYGYDIRTLDIIYVGTLHYTEVQEKMAHLDQAQVGGLPTKDQGIISVDSYYFFIFSFIHLFGRSVTYLLS